MLIRIKYKNDDSSEVIFLFQGFSNSSDSKNILLSYTFAEFLMGGVRASLC